MALKKVEKTEVTLQGLIEEAVGARKGFVLTEEKAKKIIERLEDDLYAFIDEKLDSEILECAECDEYYLDECDEHECVNLCLRDHMEAI